MFNTKLVYSDGVLHRCVVDQHTMGNDTSKSEQRASKTSASPPQTQCQSGKVSSTPAGDMKNFSVLMKQDTGGKDSSPGPSHKPHVDRRNSEPIQRKVLQNRSVSKYDSASKKGNRELPAWYKLTADVDDLVLPRTSTVDKISSPLSKPYSVTKSNDPEFTEDNLYNDLHLRNDADSKFTGTEYKFVRNKTRSTLPSKVSTRVVPMRESDPLSFSDLIMKKSKGLEIVDRTPHMYGVKLSKSVESDSNFARGETRSTLLTRMYRQKPPSTRETIPDLLNNLITEKPKKQLERTTFVNRNLREDNQEIFEAKGDIVAVPNCSAKSGEDVLSFGDQVPKRVTGVEKTRDYFTTRAAMQREKKASHDKLTFEPIFATKPTLLETPMSPKTIDCEVLTLNPEPKPVCRFYESPRKEKKSSERTYATVVATTGETKDIFGTLECEPKPVTKPTLLEAPMCQKISERDLITLNPETTQGFRSAVPARKIMKASRRTVRNIQKEHVTNTSTNSSSISVNTAQGESLSACISQLSNEIDEKLKTSSPRTENNVNTETKNVTVNEERTDHLVIKESLESQTSELSEPMKQIAEVRSKVDSLKERVETLNGNTSSKQFQHLKTLLLTCAAELDNIDSMGVDQIRTQKKQLRREIEDTLSELNTCDY